MFAASGAISQWTAFSPKARRRIGTLCSRTPITSWSRRRSVCTPYRIGLHWPSKAWGDEEIGGEATAFAAADPVALYAQRLGDRPGLRDAIATVFRNAATRPDAQRLPDEAERAYRDIDALLVELRADGEGAAPGGDRAPFNPQACFQAARADASFGLGDIGQNLLAPLRALSFWKMKQRASVVGAGGAHAFCRDVQGALAARDARIHLMGHSFGGILACSAVLAPNANDLKMRAADQDYGFAAGAIYNLEASEFICKGDGLAGAHSDIDGAEVAHAIWQGAMAD